MVSVERDGNPCLRARFVGRSERDSYDIGVALDTWVYGRAPEAADVHWEKDWGVNGITLTVCDTGDAAPAPVRDGDEILTFASLRDVFYEGLLEQGAPSKVAQCAADGIVQDPALAPVIAAPYDDPDQETIAALRERVLGAVSSCRHLAT